jgi:hypothetical protein
MNDVAYELVRDHLKIYLGAKKDETASSLTNQGQSFRLDLLASAAKKLPQTPRIRGVSFKSSQHTWFSI